MIRIGESAATLDQPIEHLMACHRRIEDRLSILERAADSLGANRAGAVDAILKSIGFLDTSGVLHTEDEEVSLFPRLRPQLSTAEREYIDSLEEQHREAESVFAALKATVPQLANADTADAVYTELAHRLADLYRRHIQSEDEILTQMARRQLGEAQLKSISGEMRERRQKR